MTELEPLHTDARERVLQVAERLFTQRGYAAVTLRDIAAEVGIRHASLYHHAPGGKEDLYVEVIERNLARHRQAISAAIADASPDLRRSLYAVADWLVSQPPMDLLRMVHADLPALDPANARRLMALVFETMLEPVAQILDMALARGEIRRSNTLLMAGSIISMVEGLHAAPADVFDTPIESMAHEVIDALLDGIRVRSIEPVHRSSSPMSHTHTGSHLEGT